MKVFSINPNSNTYFEDKSDYKSISDNMYQGTFNHTPVFPLYTFATRGRFNYMNKSSEIEFYTMLPVKRLLSNYFVEIRFRYTINPRFKNSLNIAIDKFNEFCEKNKKELNVRTLLSLTDC